MANVKTAVLFYRDRYHVALALTFFLKVLLSLCKTANEYWRKT